MLSSLNAYGGLSANQLLSLFGAKPSPAAQAPQSPSSPASPASRGADPASAIKSILAQSQVAQSSALRLGGATTASEGSSSLAFVSVTRAPIGLNIAESAFSEIASGGAVASMNYSEVEGIDTVTFNNAIVSPASASARTDASTTMEFGRAIANSSVGVGFTVAGLGPMTVGYGDVYSPLTPQGTFSVSFQLDFDAAQGTAQDGAPDTAGGQDVSVTGLSAAQAQSLQQGFATATGGAAAPGASVYTNTEKLAGMDVEFTSWISDDAPTANVSGA